MGQGTSPLWGVGATPRLGGIGSGATFAGRSPLAPCKGKVPNPRSGWCNLLHQLTNGVLRATLECSKERHGRETGGKEYNHACDEIHQRNAWTYARAL